MKRARKAEKAVRATISQYLDAILSKRGAHLLRGGSVDYLSADEMDRLDGEWLAFRGPDVEAEQ